MQFAKKQELIDSLFECYRYRRNAHSRSAWLTMRSFVGRLTGSDRMFQWLRNCDLEFFRIAHQTLNECLRDADLSKKEAAELAMYLQNHRSLIAERNSFLIFYVVAVGVLTLIPSDDWLSWVFAGLSTIIGSVAAIERWHMMQKDAIYNELIALLQYEAAKS